MRHEFITSAEVKEKIRNEYEWQLERITNYHVSAQTAIQYAYGYGQGILAVLPSRQADELLNDDDFQSAWSAFKQKAVELEEGGR